MDWFGRRQIHEALACARDGGQALHVYQALSVPAPGRFRKFKLWAHLFDRDSDRLLITARRLGVRRIVIHREGTAKQHLDLCGKPLQRAVAMAGQGELFAR